MCIIPWYSELRSLFRFYRIDVLRRIDACKSKRMLVQLEEILAFVVMLLHLIICPYTKVEESFNIQAMHDIYHHGINVENFDHLEFPGVVPRTFLGPLFICITAAPFVTIVNFLHANKFIVQYIVRASLGLFVLMGLTTFSDAVQEKFDAGIRRCFFIITMSQFHFMFYMSRPLPNIFALALVLLALSAWMRQQYVRFFWYSGAAILVFRAELVLFLSFILLMELISGRMTIWAAIKHTIQPGIVLLALTVLVDSLFWQRWLWPEGEVFWYNTVLNKSSNWGTLPFLWYFYSAIPRALGFSMLLVPIGMILPPYRQRVVMLVLPAVAFVLLYSILPHKELRFIIYVFPVLNVAAACVVMRLWRNRSKSLLQKLFGYGAVLHILANTLITGLLLYISFHNYPGGIAMQKLHQLEHPDTEVHVHIDVATAQTGVTRFTQINDRWIYNKTENLEPGGLEMMSYYTHLFIGASNDKDKSLQPYLQTHRIISKIEGFDRIQIDVKSFPPLKIIKSPKIYILKRDSDNDVR